MSVGALVGQGQQAGAAFDGSLAGFAGVRALDRGGQGRAVVHHVELVIQGEALVAGNPGGGSGIGGGGQARCVAEQRGLGARRQDARIARDIDGDASVLDVRESATADRQHGRGGRHALGQQELVGVEEVHSFGGESGGSDLQGVVVAGGRGKRAIAAQQFGIAEIGRAGQDDAVVPEGARLGRAGEDLAGDRRVVQDGHGIADGVAEGRVAGHDRGGRHAVAAERDVIADDVAVFLRKAAGQQSVDLCVIRDQDGIAAGIAVHAVAAVGVAGQCGDAVAAEDDLVARCVALADAAADNAVDLSVILDGNNVAIGLASGGVAAVEGAIVDDLCIIQDRNEVTDGVAVLRVSPSDVDGGNRAVTAQDDAIVNSMAVDAGIGRAACQGRVESWAVRDKQGVAADAAVRAVTAVNVEGGWDA